MDNNEKTLEQYIEEKITMLKRDFKIRITPDDKDKFYDCKTEIAVDNYARSLFMNRL